MSESVVLCEGYHDRAFWAGWLDQLGCTDPGRPEGSGRRVKVLDPWGKIVAAGQYGYHSKSDRFVRVVPCNGRTGVLPEARSRLNDEAERQRQGASKTRLSRLVVNVDTDLDADRESDQTGLRLQDLHALVREYDPDAVKDENDDLVLLGGATRVSLVRWDTRDAAAAGLPNQQTLERVVCAAIVAAYPPRGPAVQKWLEDRQDAPPAGPKEFSWSHMAGWYAEHGCQDFFQHVWRDEKVRAELRSRLTDSGAWRIAEALAE